MIPSRPAARLLLTGVVFGLTAALAVAGYVVTDLGNSGISYSPIYPGQQTPNAAINASGAVAYNAPTTTYPFGFYPGPTDPFLYSGGKAKDLGSLAGSFGYYSSGSANGINASGQVVGSSLTSDNQTHAFLYSNGKMKDLGGLGGTISQNGQLTFSSAAWGINDKGQVVGSSSTYGFMGSSGIPQTHAFLYSNGSMKDVGVLGTTGGLFGQSFSYSSASGINNAGQVVGVSTTNGGTMHGFLYGNGKMTDLGSLGATTTLSGTIPGSSAATGINSAGQVVGASTTSSGQTHGFLYINGKMTDLGTLGSIHSFGQSYAYSYANGINDLGQAVGTSTTNNGPMHAFLYSGGKLTDLNTLLGAHSNWTLYGALGINAHGQIVAYGVSSTAAPIFPGSVTGTAQVDTVLLTPGGTPSVGSPAPAHSTPEPGSLTLVGIGLFGLAGYGWRRRK